MSWQFTYHVNAVRFTWLKFPADLIVSGKRLLVRIPQAANISDWSWSLGRIYPVQVCHNDNL
jgi:hypothetical protein